MPVFAVLLPNGNLLLILIQKTQGGFFRIGKVSVLQNHIIHNRLALCLRRCRFLRIRKDMQFCLIGIVTIRQRKGHLTAFVLFHTGNNRNIRRICTFDFDIALYGIGFKRRPCAEAPLLFGNIRQLDAARFHAVRHLLGFHCFAVRNKAYGKADKALGNSADFLHS